MTFTLLSDHLADGYFHVGFNHVLPTKYAKVMVGQTLWEQSRNLTQDPFHEMEFISDIACMTKRLDSPDT